MAKKKFKANYTVYEIDEKYGANGDPYECSVQGYGSVEALKAETIEVIEKMIADKKIADGKAKVLIEIIELINGVYVYFDNDEVDFEIVKGKAVNFEW